MSELVNKVLNNWEHDVGMVIFSEDDELSIELAERVEQEARRDFAKELIDKIRKRIEMVKPLAEPDAINSIVEVRILGELIEIDGINRLFDNDLLIETAGLTKEQYDKLKELSK